MKEIVTIQKGIRLSLVSCYQCSINFGLPEEFDRHRKDDKQAWYCPNGHGQVYIGRPISDRLAEAERQKLSLQQQLDQAEADVMRKGKQLASLKKRANAGLCPHCHRHFTNVERHIESKHPAERCRG